jgi:hypothetical protein
MLPLHLGLRRPAVCTVGDLVDIEDADLILYTAFCCVLFVKREEAVRAGPVRQEKKMKQYNETILQLPLLLPLGISSQVERWPITMAEYDSSCPELVLLTNHYVSFIIYRDT